MKLLSPKLLFLFSLAAALAGIVSAQGGPPPDEVSQTQEAAERRPNLLQNLGLRPDQIQQIRAMNRRRRPVMEVAQLRLREANAALDRSIYADSLDEAEVSLRLREFQAAQAEVARIRFQSEVELRKILTPDQLVRFRTLRARVADERRNALERRQASPGDRPLRRIRQLPNRDRVN